MTVCTDVYTRPQTCNTISIYPSQVHPGGRMRSSGPLIRRQKGHQPPRDIRRHDDEEAVILLMEAFLNQ